jgi:dipeptidyl aminopeptidase/acylaminoacyl peptidase
MVWGTPGNYTPVLELDEPDAFTPLVLSADGSKIYGLSEKDRGQSDLVEFDPLQRRIVRTVFSKPGVDIVGTLVDDRRVPAGVRYYEGGRLVSEYFDSGRQARLAKLVGAFPGRTVALLDGDRSGARMLVGVDGSDAPMQLYHVDLDDGKARLLDETAPWLSAHRFAPSHTLKVRAPDGLELEAFLTLPEGQGRRPLVVMPHGGPIGIADRRHFDPEVQMVASLGYAVLQVNFRGSAGYGVKFREAGHRGEGTTIVDDIDAAIAAALAAYPLDPGRMCVVGSSYGGQSGLSLAVRSPGRFRCIVSISGVSDRILFFTASDSGRRKEGRAQLERIIGDPNTQLEQMVATSPLFRVDALATPVMLVHGGEDIRVDYEHTRRLLRMLNLAGRPPVLLELPDEAHGIERMDNLVKAWEGIAGFLRQHLDATPAPASDTAARAP